MSVAMPGDVIKYDAPRANPTPVGVPGGMCIARGTKIGFPHPGQ